MPQAFLTHSNADKPFVRYLDASLRTAGVDTFFDEKHIGIGESIPEKIYDGIEASDFLIFVISDTSVKSKWVEEELSIVKMIHHKNNSKLILPVLISNVALPTSVVHIKYADFREWINPNSFRKSFLYLLTAMNIDAILPGINDTTWYIDNIAIIKTLSRDILESYYTIKGMLYADNGEGSYTMFMKYIIGGYEFDILKHMKIVESSITSYLSTNTSESLEKVLAAIHAVNKVTSKFPYKFQVRDIKDGTAGAAAGILIAKLFDVWHRLEDVRMNAEISSFSRIG